MQTSFQYSCGLSQETSCYFLLNFVYPAARVDGWAEPLECLLFSFEFCLLLDSVEELGKEVYKSCYFLLNFVYCWQLSHCSCPVLPCLAIFFWILYRKALLYEAELGELETCYFLLNFVKKTTKTQNKKRWQKTCYFLLNFVFSMSSECLSARSSIATSCYFLLNFVPGVCVEQGLAWQDRSLLFSFEFCVTPREYGNTAICSARNLLFSFEFCQRHTYHIIQCRCVLHPCLLFSFEFCVVVFVLFSFWISCLGLFSSLFICFLFLWHHCVYNLCSCLRGEGLSG